MGDSSAICVHSQRRIHRLLFCAFVVLTLIICAMPLVLAANIRGVVYDHTYNPLQKIVVTINTTPEQVRISTTGAYYFTVPAGSYRIAVTLTKNNITKEIASQEVSLAETDDIVKDLQLYDNFNIESEFSETWWTKTQDFVKQRIEIFVILTLSLVVVIAVTYGLSVYRKKILAKVAVQVPTQAQVPVDDIVTDVSATTSEVSDVNIEIAHSAEEKPAQPEAALVIATPSPVIENKSNDELMRERIVKLITQSNGTLTQKDLRKEFSVSEAKISMVLSQMETDGTIKKVKKGRINYLQLVGVIKNS